MKKNVLLIVCLLLSWPVFSQDIHFSQFYASPLNLNPALTGLFDGSYRFTGIYRNQWRSVTSPFQTFSASFDMNALKQKNTRDILGTGLNVVYDKAGSGNLSMLSIMASVSYLKYLGKNSDQYLGIGIQGGFVQRSLDFNNLNFESQYNGGVFNNNLPTGENNNSNTAYFDMQAGILWSGLIRKRTGIFVGTALHHLTQPTESLIGDNHSIHYRLTAQSGLKLKAGKNLYFTPNYIFMYQNKALENNFGLGLEYHFNDAGNTIIGAGGWYRLNDAPIATATIEHRGVRVGISYDMNTSSLNAASSYRGAFELSIIYIGKQKKIEKKLYCPRI